MENSFLDNTSSSEFDHKGHNIVVLEKTINDGTDALTPEHFTGLSVGARKKNAVGT